MKMEIKDRTIMYLSLIVVIIAIISVSYNMVMIKESENKIDELEQEIIELTKVVYINYNGINELVEMWETQLEFNEALIDILR